MPYVAKGVTAEVTGRLNKHKSWESDGLQTKIGELTCRGFKGSLPNFSHIWHRRGYSGGIAIPSDGHVRGGASPAGNESGGRRGRLQRQQQ